MRVYFVCREKMGVKYEWGFGDHKEVTLNFRVGVRCWANICSGCGTSLHACGVLRSKASMRTHVHLVCREFCFPMPRALPRPDMPVLWVPNSDDVVIYAHRTRKGPWECQHVRGLRNSAYGKKAVHAIRIA